MGNASTRRLAIVTCALLAACDKHPQAPPATTIGVDPVVADEADRIGIAECDDYLDRYEACLASKAPEGARQALHASMQQTRANWRKSLAARGGNEAMIVVCQRARMAARPSMTAYGCADF